MSTPTRENWGSKFGFIMAAAGSAVGLGNIWKYPYVVGQNGGAAFIFIYIFCIILVGLPLVLAEIAIGRTTQKNPIGAFKELTKSNNWSFIGGMGILAGFVILSFYCIVAGWSIGYFIESINGTVISYTQASEAGAHFNELISNPFWVIGYQLIFILVTMFIVVKGIKDGIEKGCKFLMPALFVILLILVVRGLTMEGSSAGVEFLLKPDFSKVTGNTILMALGQAFFSMSLGMGALLTYGSYMNKKDNIPSASISIIVLDVLVAILAGVAIFTAVFATGQNPGEGPSLIFQTLPLVFNKMTGGYIFSVVFFFLLIIAAITSSVSLLEVIVSYFVDEKKWTRKKAVLIFGSLSFLIGIPSALSFNVLSDFKIFGLTFFDLADYFASNILLPLGGLLIAIFVIYKWGIKNAITSLKEGSENLFDSYPFLLKLWEILLKYIAPVLIIFVFLNKIGVI